MRKRTAVALGLLLVSSSMWLESRLFSPRLARACGGVFSRRDFSDERRPSLAYEQTLLIHDADKGREHFVRAVTFRASKEAFGFVVPTPTRPRVERIAKDPFERLRSMFPFGSVDRGELGTGLKLGGGGTGTPGGAVQVLEQKKVGSFTAFVLSASDPTALSAWLAKHDLTSTPEADAWLGHYVKMGFYYVAMRYDPPAREASDSAERTESEVVRFSFDTPLPYYPYFEPAPPKGQSVTEPRMLEVWLVTQRVGVPVAARSADGKVRWVRPFAEGRTYSVAVRDDLASALGPDPALLPGGQLVVQRFVDQKSSRVGFGDTLFVPAKPVAFDAATERRIAPLLAVLDPSLAGAASEKRSKP